MVDKKQGKSTGEGGLAGRSRADDSDQQRESKQDKPEGQDGSAPRADDYDQQRAPVHKQRYRPKLFGNYKVGAVACPAVSAFRSGNVLKRRKRPKHARDGKVWVRCFNNEWEEVRTQLYGPIDRPRLFVCKLPSMAGL